MKSRDAILRLKRFQVEESRRRVVQLETMIAEFSRMALELNREIANEETRTGNTDPAHFAYSTYARAARARRDNLKNSATDLGSQLEDAKTRLAEAQDELAKAQGLESREKGNDAQRDEAVAPGAGRLARL
ncbi:MAG: flagellar export protein FliJ [Hyphomicrobiales bacterium]|nr:flagellar export protein FliJ [Hyphomicrobiales bacterium]